MRHFFQTLQGFLALFRVFRLAFTPLVRVTVGVLPQTNFLLPTVLETCMSSRGRRGAPARHASPKSVSRFLGPIVVGAVLVLGGSAATGTPSVLTSQTDSSLVAAGSPTKAPTAQAPQVKVVSGVGAVRMVSRVKQFKLANKIVHSAQVERGTKILRSKGINGKVRYVYRVRILKGKTIARTLVAKKVVTKARAAVYIVGTGKPVKLTIDAKAAAGKTGTPEGNMKFAQVYISQKYNWNQTQYGCLVALWNRESHWNHVARNRSSGAYGIPQAMPGDKMSKFGDDWQTNPVTQIKWGVNYIDKRYDTPCGALAHSDSTGWY